MDVLRIQVTESLHRDSDYGTYLLEMEILVDLESVNLGRQADVVWLYAIFFVIVEGVHGSNEGGHIASRLARKIVVDVPEILVSAGPAYGLCDVSGPAVVRGNRQIPVSEDAIGIIEIPRGRVRRFIGVKSLVYVGIDFEAIVLGGSVHELPHSLGPRP